MLITDNDRHRNIGPDNPPFIVAEISSNHNQDFDIAHKLITKAKDCGVDAVKFQVYEPKHLTLEPSLYAIYNQMALPIDWLPELFKIARDNELFPFASVFSPEIISILEKLSCPIYKIASFEVNYLALLDRVKRTGKPVFISTGMMGYSDYSFMAQRFSPLSTIFLYCISNYPAKPNEFNLRTILALRESFGFDFGISDHSTGVGVSIVAIGLGAVIIEKHFTLKEDSPDPFSLLPDEMTLLVGSAKSAWEALGTINYEIKGDRTYLRSLYAINNIKKGERFTSQNIGILRPNKGINPKALGQFLNRRASGDISAKTPLHLRHIE